MATTDLATTAEALVAPGRGILAADESTGTIATALRVDRGRSRPRTSRRAYRELLFTAAGHRRARICGVILFDETIRQSADGRNAVRRGSSPSAGMIPGIKVDTGAKPLALRAGRDRSPRASTACASGWPSTASSARASPSGAP